ncbi:hypothetical protein [Emticicia sp. SJ17W-69]|uniref:hypothetical protein n=1 Tax=Emticicia sp. SJ17W-69 TaxID=3421657 RepID=UPI003EC02139
MIIIIQLIGGCTLIPWFGLAGLSFMSFDTPKATKKLIPWLFIFSVFSYPFIIGGSYWWAWSTFMSGNIKSAIFWSSLPIGLFVFAYLVIIRSPSLLRKSK